MTLTPEALEALRGQLIVSCQAYPGEPLRDPRTTAQMAASAVIGGAAAVRVQGLADVQFTLAAVEVPVIGLWKDGHDGVFIHQDSHALVRADCGSFDDAAAGFGVPLIAEGRLHSPAQARQCLDAGAFAVVVGTAITHPATITGWFAEALK